MQSESCGGETGRATSLPFESRPARSRATLSLSACLELHQLCHLALERALNSLHPFIQQCQPSARDGRRDAFEKRCIKLETLRVLLAQFLVSRRVSFVGALPGF